MRRKQILPVSQHGFLLCAISASLVLAVSAPQKIKTVSLSSPLPDGEPVGRWDGNALLQVENHFSRAPILHVFNRSGEEIQRILVQVPGADLISILNNRVARSHDGYIAVGDAAYGNDRGAGFLAIIAPDGSSQTVVRTEPFVPYTVAFASDGNIWAAGLENDANGEARKREDYLMVRRFDRKGQVLGGTLSRLEFSTPYTPVNGSVLVTSSDRVGWFVPRASRYVEFSLDGGKISDYGIDVPELGLGGAVLCEDNTFWVSVQQSDQSVVRSLDRKSGALVERFSQRPFLYLYGCSSNTLVGTSDWSELSWFATH